MKQKTRNIFIVFLSAMIFFVGTGVTVVDLCCMDCVSNLVQINKTNDDLCEKMIPETDSCCSHELDFNSEYNFHQTNDNCCNIERITVDISHNSSKSLVSSLFAWSTNLLNNDNIDSQSIESFSKNLETNYQPPTSIPPRAYLSLIRILII